MFGMGIGCVHAGAFHCIFGKSSLTVGSYFKPASPFTVESGLIQTPSFFRKTSMKSALRALLFQLPLTVLMLAGTSLAGAQLPPADTAELVTYGKTPDAAGELVYRGVTYTQRSTAGQTPLYRYERRVAAMPTGVVATHATSDPQGQIIIVETAAYSSAYELQRFDAVNLQAGYSGSAVVSNNGRHVEYRLNDNGKVSTASDYVSDPIVTGPSMFGFILSQWDALLAGQTIPVRLLVLKQKTTYGFDVRLENQGQGQTAFSITPNNFIIRMAISPLRVTFDTAHQTAVRYEGRVPPMEMVEGKAKDLDARVEYTSITPRYR